MLAMQHSLASSAKPARVVVMTSVHGADDGRIFHKQCQTLAGAGYDVVLIAPGAENEDINGVRVRGVPRRRGRFLRMAVTVPQVFLAGLRAGGDVFHFHDPELIPAGLLLKLLGKVVIYDAHEDLPGQIVNKSWIPAGVRAIVAFLVKTLEPLLARLFDRVLAATPAIAARYANSELIQNFPQAARFDVAFPPYATREPVVVYVGGITVIRCIREMIQAVEMLDGVIPARLVLAGPVDPPGLVSEIMADKNRAKVEFVGKVDYASVCRILARARAGLCLMHAMPNHIESQPNKLFEYMAAGLPVIASNFPLWREIVEGAGCGLLVDPKDPAAIAGAIRWILENPEQAQAMGERGKRAVEERYRWEVEAERLIRTYQDLIGSAGKAGAPSAK